MEHKITLVVLIANSKQSYRMRATLYPFHHLKLIHHVHPTCTRGIIEAVLCARLSLVLSLAQVQLLPRIGLNIK